MIAQYDRLFTKGKRMRQARFRPTPCALLLAMGLIAANANAETITFDGFAAGDTVSNVFGDTGTGPIGVTGLNPALGVANAARIVDSSAPPAGDTDLGTPNGVAVPGGPGVGLGGESGAFINDQPLGNILIVNTDLTNVPNDTADPGAQITLDFSGVGPVTMNSITIIDIDTAQTATVDLITAGGVPRATITFPVPATGDNGVAVVALGPTPNVLSVIVHLGGSGAIDNVAFGATPTGSCCLFDGSCQVLTEPQCNQLQGQFQGLNTDCTPDIPVIVGCPTDITVDAQAGTCDAVVTWVPPTVIDNCPGATLTSTHNPGDTFPLGTTTVTYTATDAAGNTSTCSFDVTVVDNQNPTITGCPANITAENDPGACTASVGWTPPTASDNCPGVTLSATHNPGDTFPVGTTTVTYTATDGSGNTATCSFDVTVTDIEPPVFSACPGDLTAITEADCTVDLPFPPVVTDNCTGAVNLTITTDPQDLSFVIDPNSGAIPPFTVTATATDEAGNSATCSVLVTIVPGEGCVPTGQPFACCLPDDTCRDIDATFTANDCEARGGNLQPGTCSDPGICTGCDPNEPGISLLFSNIFRGLVCGTGCPAFIIASFLGIVTLKLSRVRRKRRQRR